VFGASVIAAKAETLPSRAKPHGVTPVWAFNERDKTVFAADRTILAHNAREKRTKNVQMFGILALERSVIHWFKLFKWMKRMFPPKALLDSLTQQASRLFGEGSPRADIENQFKALMQSGFSKLDLVSREEFDSQMLVLERTRARLEALEARLANLEGQNQPASAAQPAQDAPTSAKMAFQNNKPESTPPNAE
jgi:BMFP domain-containing protein YqiC/predicted nucleic acid-binding Zn ribbon protein